jgi:hypothetical protein
MLIGAPKGVGLSFARRPTHPPTSVLTSTLFLSLGYRSLHTADRISCEPLAEACDKSRYSSEQNVEICAITRESLRNGRSEDPGRKHAINHRCKRGAH